METVAPNAVPKQSSYLALFHLTQLGVSTIDPTQSTDHNPLIDGKEASGPQGFLCYCKDIDTLPTLPPPLPSQEQLHGVELVSPKGDSKRGSVMNGAGDRTSKAAQRQSVAVVRKEKNPNIDRVKDASGGGPIPDRSSKQIKRATKKKSESERAARKEEKRRRAALPPVYVEKLEDFPEEAQKLIQKAKIPDEKLLANINCFDRVDIIRFRTGFNVRTKQEVQETKKSHSRQGSLNTENLDLETETPQASGDEALKEKSNEDGTGTNKEDKERERDDELDSDMLESGIVPKGGAEQFDSNDVKKIYKNLQASGRGGFGSVYIAKSSLDKTDVAIKKIAHVTKKAKRTNFNEIGFLNFCKHPNIVKYYRSHLVEDEVWLVMEYMHGGTLSEAVERYSFAESSIAYVTREVLTALEYLHSNSLVHRDLKSANIMLTVEGRNLDGLFQIGVGWVVGDLLQHGEGTGMEICRRILGVGIQPESGVKERVDFGLCVDHTQRRLCHMAGSPFWMPPEMILGIPHGPAADIWSLAICLLELANGKPPNRKSPIRAMFYAATEGIKISHPEKYSDEFKDFLARCLQIDQTKRATPTELKQHAFIKKADSQETMKKILAQIFISNAISTLDYGL